MRIRRSSDEGFSLIEVVVAISLLAIITTAAAGFFVRGFQSTIALHRRQAAAAVADKTMENARSLSPVVPRFHLLPESDLFKAHSLSNTVDVSSQWASATGIPKADTDYMYLANGVSATSASPYAWKETSTISGVPYTSYVYLGRCWQSNSASGSRNFDCTSGGYYVMLRMVVVVTWPAVSNQTCKKGVCSFSTSTYMDPHPDILFNSLEGSP